MSKLQLPPNSDYFEVGETLKSTYKIKEKIGTGGFGQIYSALNIRENTEVAIKVENAEGSRTSLGIEVYVLKNLQRKYKTKTKTLNYIAMTLCGQNLAKLRRCSANSNFSIGTCLRLSLQILQSLEDIHGISFLHRDVKPSNFCLGTGNKSRIVVMIDFGLCRQFINPITKKIKEPRNDAGFRGTVRYASITTHLHQEMSQVDDLWSMFYMMIEFIVGRLPWCKNTDAQNALAMKQQVTPDILLAGQPEKLFEFAMHLSTLQYGDTPDYNKLRAILSMIMADYNQSIDGPFDWEQLGEEVTKIQTDSSATKSTRLSIQKKPPGQSTTIHELNETDDNIAMTEG